MQGKRTTHLYLIGENLVAKITGANKSECLMAAEYILKFRPKLILVKYPAYLTKVKEIREREKHK